MRDLIRWGAAAAAVCLVFSASFPAAQAQTSGPAGGGLLVSPTYVLFEGRDRSKSLILTNRGDHAETYRITIINRQQMPDGQLVEIDKPVGDAGFAAPLVRYAPRQVVLQPNQPQTVRLLLMEPGNLADGEYRSHVLLQQVPTTTTSDAAAAENPKGLSVKIRAIFGITVPLIVRKGNLTATAVLSDLKLVRLNDQSQGLMLHLDRSGTRSLRGDIAVRLDDDVIGKLTGVNVFLSTPYRELVVPLTAKGELKGRHLSVDFSEDNELPGAASARQSLTP